MVCGVAPDVGLRLRGEVREELAREKFSLAQARRLEAV